MNIAETQTKSGVYKIVNGVNGKIYIGSSYNIRKRLAEHRNALRKGAHINRKLQRAWVKYGEHAFTCAVVELCNVDDLIPREQVWLDSLKPEYNICRTAGSTRGVRLSDAMRANLKRCAERRVVDNPEHHAKMTAKANAATRALWATAHHREHMASKMGEFAVRLRKYVTFNGVTDSLEGWAERTGINYPTLKTRLQRWSVEEALTTPATARGRSACMLRAKRKGQLFMLDGVEVTVDEAARAFGVSRPGLSWYVKRHGFEAATAHYRGIQNAGA